MHVRIDIAGYWHSGTGTGYAAGADALVVRDRNGVPYLPGKHLKGLLRHAMWALETNQVVELGVTDRLFGVGAEGVTGVAAKTRYGTSSGKLAFGSAEMSKSWREFAAARGSRQKLTYLFRTIQQTALSDGVALASSLRSIEVTVPMELTAEVDWVSELTEQEIEALELAAGTVRAVGGFRSRGLGRAKVEVVA